ncbi:MAG: amidohydrolase family protein [Planctomycetota bacterium]
MGMIIDCHTHLFSSKIIAGVSKKKQLVEELDLDIESAASRHSPDALTRECEAAGVAACLLLPTASSDDVARVNVSFLEIVKDRPLFHTAGTLHPHYSENETILEHLAEKGIRAIKLCSFSQGFSLKDEATDRLFELITRYNSKESQRFFVVLDTFYKASIHFGTPEEHNTTPARLGRLVKKFPEIPFIAAHMGGLTAPFQDVLDYLEPTRNLYLETSNAAHTLAEEEFVRLLRVHGSEHILFGTDWPWFSHEDEKQEIGRLMELAGYGPEDRDKVYFENIAALLDLPIQRK